MSKKTVTNINLNASKDKLHKNLKDTGTRDSKGPKHDKTKILIKILDGKTFNTELQNFTSDCLISNLLRFVENDTLIFHLKPLHRILLGHSVLNPNTGFTPTATSNTVTRTFQNHKEIHTIDTRRRIISAIKQLLIRNKIGGRTLKYHTYSVGTKSFLV